MDLSLLHAVLKWYIENKLIEQWYVGEELYLDCLKKTDDELIDDAVSSAMILRELFDRLQQIHRVRIVN